MAAAEAVAAVNGGRVNVRLIGRRAKHSCKNLVLALEKLFR
jgi:hypothetical protein